MKDKKPTCFELNYKYRDPVGVRVEFQSFVDPVGSRELHDLERLAEDKLRHCLGSAAPKMVEGTAFLRRTFSNLQTSTEYTAELALFFTWCAGLFSYFSSFVAFDEPFSWDKFARGKCAV